MAKKSEGAIAAQEVARVAAAGQKKKEDRTAPSGGRRRIFGFGSLIVLIMILGIGLVAYARVTREVSARPRQNEDHWHSAYGFWDCAANNGQGDFELPFLSENDPVGIHSHQDGVMHIHPWFEAASGKSSTISHFYTAMGVSVTENAVVLPDGRTWNAGEECDGEPSIITVRRWRDINSLDKDPVIYTEDLDDIRFFDTGEVFVIARAPEGADVPIPPQQHIDNTFSSTEGLISRPPVTEPEQN